MAKKKTPIVENTSIEAVSAAGGVLFGMAVGNAVGGSVGAAVGGYWGAVVTPVMASLAKSLLIPRQLERMERVHELGKQKYKAALEKGSRPRAGISFEEYVQFTEGILLTSKDTYEEKKIPLLANLVAHTPFTNTPIDNMLQTLHEAERLSYRQLCLLSVIDHNDYERDREQLALSKVPFRNEKDKHLNELAEGVYQDLNLMVVDGIIAMVASEEAGAMMASGAQFITPYDLRLLYPGRLLVNGLELAGISKDETLPLIDVLRST